MNRPKFNYTKDDVFRNLKKARRNYRDSKSKGDELNLMFWVAETIRFLEEELSSESELKIADEVDSPEPEPEFAGIKVDDWVLLDTGNQCPVIRVYTDNQGFAVKHRGAEYCFDLMGNSIYSDEYKVLRELDPTEVEVEIKLKGTVSECSSDPDEFFCLHAHHADEYIAYDDIAPATAETIRKLIKAQEKS